jgi:hypothetical protein
MWSALAFVFALTLALPWGARAEPAPAQAIPERDVTVVNRAARAINELYVSPSSADHWGDDRLGDATLAPGRSAHLRLGRARDCEFDMQVVYEDASREEVHAVNLCRLHQVTFDGSGATMPPPAVAATHEVTIANRSARPIQQVLISSAAAGDWGDDRLANRSISVGDSATLRYRGDCVADLRVVFDNRAAEERRDIDLCTARRIAVQPGWTTADSIPTEAQPGAASVLLTVTNGTGHAATGLYLFPDGSADRGPELLDTGGLGNGGQVSVALLRPAGACAYAAHVVFGGKLPDRDFSGFDLCRSQQVLLPPPR